MNIVKILKKNISIIIPVLITVVAVLVFIPVTIMRGKISAKLGESIKLGKEVDSALRANISAKQYEAVKIFEDMHEADANEIEKLARQTSQRELLSYKIFPEPNETSIQIFNEFRLAYVTAFAGLAKDMKALDAPTDMEIRKEAGPIDVSAALAGRGSSDGTKEETEEGRIIELLCRRRSEETPVYANPKAFSGYAVWDSWEYRGIEDALNKCWYSQLAYWIHKDVVGTINAMNEGSASTTNSSVKRLLGVRFARSDAASFTLDNSLELPVYVIDAKNGLYQNWTGRKCDDQIDVVHFSLAVIIRADDILKFMNELCSGKEHYFSGYKGDQEPEKYKHNQITILQNRVEPVDRGLPEHRRYFYGNDAVVLLNLVCEYVFNRSGYDQIKPKYVQGNATGQAVTNTEY
ncbi:MAG: hypothetical protein PHQ00_01800 [Phycisphaerae bacterium]|nr:hypothetical protein [Phycisphaerae bacterium]